MGHFYSAFCLSGKTKQIPLRGEGEKVTVELSHVDQWHLMSSGRFFQWKQKVQQRMTRLSAAAAGVDDCPSAEARHLQIPAGRRAWRSMNPQNINIPYVQLEHITNINIIRIIIV